MSLLDPRQFIFCLGGPTTNSLLGTMPDSLSGTSPIRSEGGGKMTSSFRISDILHSQTEHNTSTESEPRASSEECRASPLRGSPLGEDSLRGSPPSEHSPNGTKKARKARTIFTDKQLQELENTFDKQKYLSVQDRMDLAHRMGLSDTQVKTWYQNRRTKWKRQASTGMDLLADAGNMAAVQQLLRSNPYWSGYMGGPQNSLGGPQLGGHFAMGPNIPLMMGLAPNFPLSFPFMLPTSQPPKDSSPPINVSSEE